MSDKKFYQEVCKTMEYKEKIKQLKKENQKYKEVIDKVKIEISSLMSRYFYDKAFCVEDTHLDKILQMLDGVEDNE